jgi:UDP-N-acetyl-D-glucosamine dehydrogenase
VVGLGYVGLPLAVAFAEAGDSVVALDTDVRKIAAIHRGDSYIEDISSERLLAARIDATTRYAKLAKADAVIICVPTPLTRNREPDLGPLLSAARGMRDVLQAGQLVVLESTNFPRHHARSSRADPGGVGLKVGLDFNAAFSPERVDPGRTDHTLRSTPQTHLAAAFLALAVVIGLTVAPCWPWASSSST